MTFTSYYNSLDKKGKRELRNKIVVKAKVSHSSIYNWTEKPVNPHPLVQDAIAKIIGKPARELFP